MTNSILQHFRKIQRIFYLIGVSPWHYCSENRIDENCFRRVPVLISFLSSICVAVIQFTLFYLESFGLINKLVNYAFFGCLLFANVTANLQCWFGQSTYLNIINGIRRWETDFNFKFSRKIFYKSMRLHYGINAVLIISCFSISAAIVLGQAWLVGSHSTIAVVLASFTTFKELMCSLATLHFTLYVDIVTLLTASINKQIHRSTGCFYASTRVPLLKEVKSMHMDLFLLMKEVNNFFGWQLLFVMIHYLVLIMYSMYWMFLAVRGTGKIYSIVEPTVTLTYCVLSVTILVNACEYCSLETMQLMENVEKFGFYASDNIRLHEVKSAVSAQIRNFSFDVTAKGYFTFNRRLLTAITSGCCTYFIILIQFTNTEDHSKLPDCAPSNETKGLV